jgi:CBS domain-containing protein
LVNQVVGSIARNPVPSVGLTTPITEVSSLMAENDIGAVIVIKGVEVLGIVTESDIIEKIAQKRDLIGLVTQDIMTSPVITIHYDRPISDALKIMIDNNLRRLVVVDDKSNFGIVTQRRLLLANFNEQNKNNRQI